MAEKEFLETFGFLLGQEFLKAAPKDTGKLARSFTGTMRVDRDEIVYSLPDYAEYVEFGTMPHMIKPKTKKALKFKGSNGEDVIVKQVNHPGTRPTFFIRDTAHRKLPDVLKKTIDILNK